MIPTPARRTTAVRTLALTDDQRLVGLARIVALFADAHTQLLLGRFGRRATQP